MQIIIPMTGEGARFKAAGYDTLKPLILVHGKPILEYVASMFPGNNTFIFICREEHEKQYRLTSYIKSFCPAAQVLIIKGHKFGPVFAALQAEQLIDDRQPVLLSYCDYFMEWDFENFENEVYQTGEHGNVICYTGFHPHLLPEKNLYAGCRVTVNNKLVEIKEKFSFETEKSNGFHSVGAYYFKTGALMKYYYKLAIEKDLSLNGEYYASLVYQLPLIDGLNIGVYDKVKTFCQWGTPEDLEAYLYWSEIFLTHNYA